MWVKEGEGVGATCKGCGENILTQDSYCKNCAEKKLTGIGGWLYLPSISLVLVIISSVYSFVETGKLALGSQEETLKTLLFMEVAGFAMVFLLASYTTFLFLKRNVSFPCIILPFFWHSSHSMLRIFGAQYNFIMPKLILKTHGGGAEKHHSSCNLDPLFSSL